MPNLNFNVPVRILSIDWDYFIKASIETRMKWFPDGGNERILGQLSNIVWATRYVDAKRFNFDMETIEADIDAIHCLYGRVEKVNTYLCTESHKDLATYIFKGLDPDYIKRYGLEIINLDHHSDLYNIGEELNCGNWLNKVFEAFPNTKLTWVANVDSDTTLPNAPYSKNVTIKTNFSDLKLSNMPIVYICKSSIWSPPHLDKAFNRLDRHFRYKAVDVITDISLPSRWNEVKAMIEQTETEYRKFGLMK